MKKIITALGNQVLNNELKKINEFEIVANDLQYKEAIIEWHNINEEKKKGHKNSIGKQFEYNQYTRDFFENNKDKTREECIKCWNYKKSKSGSHKYEDKSSL